MKLLNQSIKHISISILAVVGIWGAVFYYNMIEEIKKNVDDGLENYKRQIIYKANRDTALLSRVDFDEAFYSIHPIDKQPALTFTDQYKDTVVHIRGIDEVYARTDPARMLTTAFEDGGKYYELKIINPMIEKNDLIHRLLINMIWLYAFLVIAIIIINNIVLQRLWKPFYQLLQKIKTYRLGSNENFPEVKTRTREFNDLQKAVNTLLSHSTQVYDQQKQFIGNASHELQTPLAIMVNKLELLLEKGNLNDEDAEKIAETMNMAERLIRVNKSLLLLTKIENKQFLDEQPVSVNRVVEQRLPDLKDIADFRKITISFVQEAELTKEMDPALAEILVSNLLRNAFFHNTPKAGAVNITISEKKLHIINTGKDMPLDADKIFDRFYKSGSGNEHTGLGLTIIKAICDLYGISITYQYKDRCHHFTLIF